MSTIGGPATPTPGARRWAALTLVAHIIFVISWLVAAAWQGPQYRVLAHSISDMYADRAPAAAFLLVVITGCGATAILFAGLALWPSLRAGGWPAAVGSALLALSIFGLGDLLTPFEREACRLADPGCTASAQLANAGGQLDAILSTVGVGALIAAGFFIAAAMNRVPAWRSWAGPTRWAAIGLMVLFIADGLSGAVNLSGLFERLLAAAGAAGIVALAVGVLQRPGVVAAPGPAT